MSIKDLQGKRLKSIKYGNHKVVISVLRQEGSASISDISKIVRLSTTAVSKIINNLMESGLVKCDGKGSSTNEGGKRPEMFSLNSDHKYGIVLIPEPGFIECYLFDIEYNIRTSISEKCERLSYRNYIKKCAAEILRLMEEQKLSPEQICGIGIAISGIINAAEGIIVYPMWRPEWGGDLPFCKDLQEELGFPLHMFLDNNCRLSGYAEMLHHDQIKGGSAAMIHASGDTTGSPGAGGCIVSHYQMKRGIHGYAGEIGHIIVDRLSQDVCSCGRKGCFQTVISSKNLVYQAKCLGKQYPDSSLQEKIVADTLLLQDIMDASNEGDRLGQCIMDLAVEYFALVTENIILLVDPEVLIIQGYFVRAGDYFLTKLRDKIRKEAFFGLNQNFKILYSQYTPWESIVTGTALHLFNSYFALNATYD